MKRPSFQWYPSDWMSAPELRACSVAARGLWIDMICMMHEGDPYGHLTLNGKVVLPGILARIVGATIDEVSAWLSELEEMGVFSRTEEGVIYSRRMVQDEEVRLKRAEGGFKALQNPNVPQPKMPEGIPSKDTLEDNQQGIPPRLSIAPSPSSSSSSSSSEKKEEEASRAPARSASSRKPKLCDEEYLEELQKNPAYSCFDVRRIHQKMVVWCELKGKQPTRARFIGWLNREDAPMTKSLNGAPSEPKRKAVF